MFCHVLFMSCYYCHNFFAFYLHHMLSDSIRLVYHLIIFSEPGNEWWWTNLIIIFLHLLYWNSAFIHILCNKNLPSLSIGLIKVNISKLRKQKWINFFFICLEFWVYYMAWFFVNVCVVRIYIPEQNLWLYFNYMSISYFLEPM